MPAGLPIDRTNTVTAIGRLTAEGALRSAARDVSGVRVL